MKVHTKNQETKNEHGCRNDTYWIRKGSAKIVLRRFLFYYSVRLNPVTVFAKFNFNQVAYLFILEIG